MSDVYIGILLKDIGQRHVIAPVSAYCGLKIMLLCDETTSGLDPPTIQSILALLKDISQHLDLTMLLITNERDVTKKIAIRSRLFSQ